MTPSPSCCQVYDLSQYNLYFVHQFFLSKRPSSCFLFFLFSECLVREQRVNFPDIWRLERGKVNTPSTHTLENTHLSVVFWDGLVTPSFDWRWRKMTLNFRVVQWSFAIVILFHQDIYLRSCLVCTYSSSPVIYITILYHTAMLSSPNKHVRYNWYSSSWWFQPIWNIWVKHGIFPQGSGWQ